MKSLENDVCRCGAGCLDEVGRGAAHLGTDPPAGNIDFRLGQHALIKHGSVLLFHAHRAAAAPDIAGDFVDVSDVYHLSLIHI